ncbi:MAG: hypothetical protein ACYC6C_11155 [Coriobacteriia bacterium]
MGTNAKIEVWIGGEQVEVTDDARLEHNLRELWVESLNRLDFVQDKSYPVKVALNGRVYEGDMVAGLDETLDRFDPKGSHYRRYFRSTSELREVG